MDEGKDREVAVEWLEWECLLADETLDD